MGKNRCITPTDCMQTLPTQKKTYTPRPNSRDFLPEDPLDIVSSINDNLSVYEIRHYLTRSEKDVFMEWRRQLRDTGAKIAVDRRINRLELGNFGDHKFCRDGVWELRIDIGPGYRVYYAIAGTQVVLLLSGGNKRTQDADIDRACAYWLDWQERAES
jgi:putative addiction module killer protein